MVKRADTPISTYGSSTFLSFNVLSDLVLKIEIKNSYSQMQTDFLTCAQMVYFSDLQRKTFKSSLFNSSNILCWYTF